MLCVSCECKSYACYVCVSVLMLKLKRILCVPLSVDVKVDNTCCVCLSVLMLKPTTHAMCVFQC